LALLKESKHVGIVISIKHPRNFPS